MPPPRAGGAESKKKKVSRSIGVGLGRGTREESEREKSAGIVTPLLACDDCLVERVQICMLIGVSTCMLMVAWWRGESQCDCPFHFSEICSERRRLI